MRFPSTSLTRPTLVRLLGSEVRMAVNDEEPQTNAGDLTPEDVARIVDDLEARRIAADIANNVNKAQRKSEANDIRALHLQMDAEGRNQGRAS
jgi:hypothetical protein